MLGGMLTAVGTLCIVVLIIYLSYVAAKLVAKGSVRAGRSQYMRMVDQLPVGQSRAVSIVQVGDRYFLLGMAEKEMHMLAELEEEGLIPLQIDGADAQAPAMDFRELLDKMGKTRKHWNDKK